MNTMIQSVAFKIASLLVSHPVKKAINRLKRKLLPFNGDEIFIEFEDSPNVLCNYEDNIFGFRILVQVRNFSPYEIQIHSCKCVASVLCQELIDLAVPEFVSIPSRAKGQMCLEKTLTEYEVRRIEQAFGSSREKEARFRFELSVTTSMGVERVPWINKHGCITMCRINNSKNRLQKVSN